MSSSSSLFPSPFLPSRPWCHLLFYSPLGSTSSDWRRGLRPKLLATCKRHLLSTEMMPRADPLLYFSPDVADSQVSLPPPPPPPLGTMRVHRHRPLRTDLLGACKRHSLCYRNGNGVSLRNQSVCCKTKRETPPKTCFLLSLRQLPRLVCVCLRPVLYPSDGELLGEGMHV